MIVSDKIRPKLINCFQGDLVQYNNQVCLVICLDKTSTDISAPVYGLLAFTGVSMGDVVLKNVKLTEIDQAVQGVLLKCNDLYITTVEEKRKWES